MLSVDRFFYLEHWSQFILYHYGARFYKTTAVPQYPPSHLEVSVCVRVTSVSKTHMN